MKHMKLFLKKMFCIALLIVLLPLAYAQNQPNTPGQSSSGQSGSQDSVDNLIGGYGSNQWEPSRNGQPALYSESYDASYAKALGQLMSLILNATISSSVVNIFNISTNVGGAAYQFKTLDDFTSQDIYRLLTDTTNANMNTQGMAQISGPLPLNQSQIAMSLLPGQKGIPYSQSSANVSVNSLLLPLQYNQEQVSSAWYFIQYVSGLAAHPPVLDLSKLKNSDLTNALNANRDFQNYIVALRNQAAITSVGLSNLYFLYASRIPQPTSTYTSLFPNFNLKQTPLYPSASAAQVDNYIANRRFQDPQWVKNIETADGPAQLQRETIYLLRDLLYEEYQRRLIDERILAAVSVTQLNTVNPQQQSNIQQLFTKLQNQKPFN